MNDIKLGYWANRLMEFGDAKLEIYHLSAGYKANLYWGTHETFGLGKTPVEALEDLEKMIYGECG